MSKKDSQSFPAVGGSSLLVIFAVLCLVVFALLCLSTVQADRRLSDGAAASVTDYYAADCAAEEIFARLRRGEAVAGVQEVNGKYTYQCPVSENQHLSVVLSEQNGSWTVLQWQVVSQLEETEEYALPVWDGAGG